MQVCTVGVFWIFLQMVDDGSHSSFVCFDNEISLHDLFFLTGCIPTTTGIFVHLAVFRGLGPMALFALAHCER